MTVSRRTRLAVSASVSALAVGALAAGPAQAAAAPATLQVKVVDAQSGDPLTNVEVTAYGNRGYVDFGGTSADGTLSLTRGGFDGSDKLTAGTYDLELDDYSLPRFKNDTTHASIYRSSVTIKAGANEQGTIEMQVGGIVDGTARTPSGHLLRGLGIEIDSDATTQEEDEVGFGYFSPTAGGDATYEQNGLPTGDYTVSYDPGGGSGNLRDADAPFTVSEPGDRITDDLTVRVAASSGETTLTGSSPGKGQARLVFQIANSRFGITDPHGVVTFASASGKQIGQVLVTEINGTGRASLTFPASSTSHSYTATYDGTEDNPADLLKTTRSAKIVVK